MRSTSFPASSSSPSSSSSIACTIVSHKCCNRASSTKFHGFPTQPLKPIHLLSPPTNTIKYLVFPFSPSAATASSNHGVSYVKFRRRKLSPCKCSPTDTETEPSQLDCVGTAQDAECMVPDNTREIQQNKDEDEDKDGNFSIAQLWEWGVLVSPFFFWGTAMVAMKEVLPKTGPFFVSAFRLIPAGFLLVGFAFLTRGGKKALPSGFDAWLSITLFALVDAACFQGFLAEGLQRTSAGLGSVIIDSQPLTVAILAALLFGESIGLVGAAGLVLGVVGLLLLEIPAISLSDSSFSLWGSGEWWMLLAAQSMAVGTVMVRWVSKFSDPVMATGFHMVIGGLPLLAISILNHDPILSGNLQELTTNDVLALLYTSLFGSAISYGVYFYSATKGSLTKLSSLTFLTPMFASIFGYIYLDETFSSFQLVGAAVTLVAIYMVNYRNSVE